MAGNSRSSWPVSVIECVQYDRRAAAQKRRGRDFPRQTQSPGQGAGEFPPASVVPSPADGRRGVEGSPALPEAELAGSLDRPENRISFHLILHRKSSYSLPLAVGGDWSPPVARRAGSCYFRAQKKPALSQWENPDTLKHGYCACFSKALLLYGYSIADALRKVKPRSGSFIIIS